MSSASARWSSPISRREVLAATEQAVRRDGGAVIIGDAGIGKSFTARAVAARLRRQGASVELVLATEAASTVPFGALAVLLEPSVEAAGDLLEVLRSTGTRLARRARGGMLLVVIDDAHRLDPASAALLLQLVTCHEVRVLATVRAAAPAPDAVTALWKDAGLLRVDLGPLSEEATGEISRQLLGGPVERGTRRWLWETSAGNPLFLRELVRSGVQEDAIVEQAGHWRRIKSIPPPGRLLDLLDERIDGLTAAERRSLALVVLAEPADLELLSRLGALAGARSLESRGLLAPADLARGPGLRAAHPLYGEALRATLGAMESRDLHAELAGELEPGGERVRLRLATWALADGRADDGELLAEGAREALAAFDPELAIRLGRAAVDAGAGVEAAFVLAAALRAVGSFADAETQLAAVEAGAGTGPRLTSYLFVRAANLHWGLGRPEDAQALLRRIHAEPAGAAVASALLSSDGRLADSVCEARRALACDAEDRLADAIAANVIGHDLPLLGDPLGALEVLDRIGGSPGAIESEWPTAATAVVGAFYAARRWDERRQALQRRREAARVVGDDGRAAMCELALTRLLMACGELTAAHRLAEDALARLAFMDPRGLAAWCHAVIAEATATAGQADAARAALRQGYSVVERIGPNPVAQAPLDRAEPLVLAAEGDHAGAQEAALACARACGEALLLEAEMHHLFMRLGGAPAKVALRLEEIATVSDAAMARLWARQATAARDQDATALEGIATEYERVGARLFAAEAAAQAAIAFGAGGSGGARRREQSRAARLASACAANGLTLVATMRTSVLTARERETAALVARGLSNAQIAERLSLSVRTVESHVYRSTTKLGVRDRAALVAVLTGREPTQV